MSFLSLNPVWHLNQVPSAMCLHTQLPSQECFCLSLSPENGQLSFIDIGSILRGMEELGSLNSRLKIVAPVQHPNLDDSLALQT